MNHAEKLAADTAKATADHRSLINHVVQRAKSEEGISDDLVRYLIVQGVTVEFADEAIDHYLANEWWLDKRSGSAFGVMPREVELAGRTVSPAIAILPEDVAVEPATPVVDHVVPDQPNP